jgi:hypothetical protein
MRRSWVRHSARKQSETVGESVDGSMGRWRAAARLCADRPTFLTIASHLSPDTL